ncbi:hypothetical protein [Streptomyces sp. CC208A]|nr:hypothetical protein [Streptomyces sp. CC208A]
MSEVIENLAYEGGTVLVTALAAGLVGAARRLPGSGAVRVPRSG